MAADSLSCDSSMRLRSALAAATEEAAAPGEASLSPESYQERTAVRSYQDSEVLGSFAHRSMGSRAGVGTRANDGVRLHWL